MEKEYIDHYGIDSLPHLIIASQNKMDVFITTNESLLRDREELEAKFKIKIRAPSELLQDENKQIPSIKIKTNKGENK